MRNGLIVLTAVLLLIPAVASAQNSPPIADAGEDQDIYVGDLTILEGSATDPDNNAIVDWLWTIETSPDGSSPYLSQVDIPRPVFEGDLPGDYSFSLVAFDGMDWSEPDYVTIHVAEMLPPVAIADADVTSGIAALTVNFDGSQSYSPQGGDLTYEWDFGDGSAPKYEVSPSHTYNFPGVYEATLTVQDGIGETDSDILEITVEEAPPAWGEASVVGVKSAFPSRGLNYLIALLIPIGAVLFWKGLRNRR